MSTTPQTTDGPASACSGGLHGLLARWAELAPDECRPHEDFEGCYRVEPYTYSVVDPAHRFCDAFVLAAVVYHVARRGLHLGLSYDAEHPALAKRQAAIMAAVTETLGPRKSEVARIQRSEHQDGGVGLCAVAFASLWSYLDAVEAV